MTEEHLDVGDEVVVKDRKQQAKSRRFKEKEELKQLLSTYAGRNFVWRILAECGIYQSSFTGTAETTFFKEGKRQIGIWLLSEIHSADPTAYARMQTEAIERGERK